MCLFVCLCSKDRHSKDWEFNPGDKGLVLLPIPGKTFQARCFGPYLIEIEVGETDYVVQTPGERKQR